MHDFSCWTRFRWFRILWRLCDLSVVRYVPSLAIQDDKFIKLIILTTLIIGLWWADQYIITSNQCWKRGHQIDRAFANKNKELSVWKMVMWSTDYRKISNIRRISVGNKIIDHSDIVGASTVGAAPTAQLHLHSRLDTWLQWIGHRWLKDGTRNI